MIQITDPKPAYRKVLCLCGKHHIEKGTMMYGIKSGGTIRYRQCNCTEEMEVGEIPTILSGFNKGEKIVAGRFHTCLVNVRYKITNPRSLIVRDYLRLQAEACVEKKEAIFSCKTAERISHILKTLEGEDVELFCYRLGEEKARRIQNFSHFKQLTDRQRKDYIQ